MNTKDNTKYIVLIASIIAVLGLLTATIFNLITIPIFITLTTTVLGILFGLIKQFENKELKSKIKGFVSSHLHDLEVIESLNKSLVYKETEILNIRNEKSKEYLKLLEDNKKVFPRPAESTVDERVFKNNRNFKSKNKQKPE